MPHTEADPETLCTRLVPVLPVWIAVEATGGLGLPAVQALSAAGHIVAQVDLRHVRDFGRAGPSGQDGCDQCSPPGPVHRDDPAGGPAAYGCPDSSPARAVRQPVAGCTPNRPGTHTAAPDMQVRMDRHPAWLAEERGPLDQAIECLASLNRPQRAIATRLFTPQMTSAQTVPGYPSDCAVGSGRRGSPGAKVLARDAGLRPSMKGSPQAGSGTCPLQPRGNSLVRCNHLGWNGRICSVS